MDARKNFEAYTNSSATFTNAMKECGEDFIKSLKKHKKLHAKSDDFWIEVNKHLNIPDDYYEQKQIEKQEEQKRKYQEQENEEQRLMDNKVLVEEDTNKREGWIIKIFQLPKSKIFSQKYLAEGTLIGDKKRLSSGFSDHKYQAKDIVVSKIDKVEKEKQKEKKYKVLKHIYLSLFYLSGWDEYLDFKHLEESEEIECQEHFIVVKSWIGLDFSILNKLEEEGLIKQPQREGNNAKKTTHIDLTRKGVKLTRELLKNLDLEGVDELLEDCKHHEDYLRYQHYLDSLKKLEDQEQE